jgi:precorrin-6B methylase 2
MKHNHQSSINTAALAVLLLISLGTAAEDFYRQGEASRDGIGKFYMGREISEVMGHMGAGWLERPERERQERTDLLLQSMELQAGDIVADIGAGTGYFTLPMARMVEPEGRVLAVEIQPQMLAIIERRMVAEDVYNIDMILGTEKNPKLPAGKVDLVLIVDAYHEFAYPREVMEGVRDSLSERGRVLLVEYRGEDPSVPIKDLHKLTVEQAAREMEAVGLQLETVGDQLPWQHIMVFKRAPLPGQTMAAFPGERRPLVSF